MFSFFCLLLERKLQQIKKCYFIDIKFRMFKQFNDWWKSVMMKWLWWIFCRTSCRQIRSVTIIVSECRDSCILSQEEGKDGWRWYRHSNYDDVKLWIAQLYINFPKDVIWRVVKSSSRVKRVKGQLWPKLRKVWIWFQFDEGS